MSMLADPNQPRPVDWSLFGDRDKLTREKTLRRNQQRLLEAIALDPSNQHARDSLRALHEVATSLGILLTSA